LTDGKKLNAWADAAVAFARLGRQDEARAALRRAEELEALYGETLTRVLENP
jgi:Flp pilus assembly protein TadD